MPCREDFSELEPNGLGPVVSIFWVMKRDAGLGKKRGSGRKKREERGHIAH